MHEGGHSPLCDAAGVDAVSHGEVSRAAGSPVEGEGEVHMSKVKLVTHLVRYNIFIRLFPGTLSHASVRVG